MEKGKVFYRLYNYLWGALDWVFPPNCGGCDVQGERFCQECADSIRFIRPPICDICGRPLEHSGKCIYCAGKVPHYDSMRSIAAFDGPIRAAIHKLKYQNDQGLGEILARMLIKAGCEPNWQVDLVIPIPLSASRLKERGYNQSGLLAFPLALYFGIKYAPYACWRVKDTKSQVGLSAYERWENVADAFQADNKFVGGKRILIIDDVTTTGATINASSLALRAAGADRIYCLTLARSVYPNASMMTNE